MAIINKSLLSSIQHKDHSINIKTRTTIIRIITSLPLKGPTTTKFNPKSELTRASTKTRTVVSTTKVATIVVTIVVVNVDVDSTAAQVEVVPIRVVNKDTNKIKTSTRTTVRVK